MFKALPIAVFHRVKYSYHNLRHTLSQRYEHNWLLKKSIHSNLCTLMSYQMVYDTNYPFKLWCQKRSTNLLLVMNYTCWPCMVGLENPNFSVDGRSSHATSIYIVRSFICNIGYHFRRSSYYYDHVVRYIYIPETPETDTNDE